MTIQLPNVQVHHLLVRLQRNRPKPYNERESQYSGWHGFKVPSPTNSSPKLLDSSEADSKPWCQTTKREYSPYESNRGEGKKSLSLSLSVEYIARLVFPGSLPKTEEGESGDFAAIFCCFRPLTPNLASGE